MKRHGPGGHSRHAFTWFRIEGTLDEAREMISGFYDDLVAMYEEANETADTSSPFYGWELKKENVKVYVEFGFDGLSIVPCPKFDQNVAIDVLYYDLGGAYYLATVENVGGRPSYTEFVKVIDYLISPIRDKVGQVDYSEVKAYCKNGRGHVVVTTDAAPRKPLKVAMKAMGLATPDDVLERGGYVGPQQLQQLLGLLGQG